MDDAAERRFVAAAVAAKLMRTARAAAISGTLNGAWPAVHEFMATIGDAASM